MSWRDKFNKGVGRFRNAEFVVKSNGLTCGRRKQIHEFPKRDVPFVEDMGGGTRQFSVEVFVLGQNYMAARDKLIAALEEKGPGILAHPYYGTLNVEVIDRPSIRESTREGGKATFSITFIIAEDEQKRLVETDTAAALGSAVDNAQTTAIDNFAAVYDTLEQAQDYVDEVQTELENALESVEKAVSGITDPITALIRAPYNMGSTIMGAFNSIKNSVKDPVRALSLYEGLFNSGSDSQQIPQTTSNRLQQIDNTAAMHRLIQQAAITEACLLTITMDFASVNDAIVMRDKLLAAIDAQIEEPAVQASTIVVSDTVYDALQQLRATLAEFIRVEAAKLPRVTYFENKASLPALVLAHRIHVDATKDTEIISRNHIRHPGFVAGGQALEVLTRV